MPIPAKSLSLLASLISTATLGPRPLEVCLRPEDAAAFLPLFGASPSVSSCGAPPSEASSDGELDPDVARARLDAAVLAVGHRHKLSTRKRGHIEAAFRRLKPGGLMVLHFEADQFSSEAGGSGEAEAEAEAGEDREEELLPLESLIDGLNRVCFDDYYRGPLPNIENQVKVALFLQNLLVLFKQGVGDEVDYLTLGDYGRAYGEGRGQLLGRLRVWELAAPLLPWDNQYFDRQLSLFEMHLEAVYCRLTLKLKFVRTTDPAHKDYILLTPRKKKKAKKMTVPQFRAALVKDLTFGLAVHPERIEVTSIEELHERGLADVEIKFLPASAVPESKVDYAFHRTVDWKNWTSYFRDQGPQPLHVVAQTFREKALMIGDDLSDFYTGSVTVGALQKRFQVTLQSPDCQSFDAAIKVHAFRCFPASTGYTERHEEPIPHSPLHRIFAKEKLDCCIGKGAFGDLRSRRIKHRWQGDEEILTQDGTMFLGGEKLIAYDRKGEMHAGWRPPVRLDVMVLDKLNEAFGLVEYGTSSSSDLHPAQAVQEAHRISKEGKMNRPLGFVDDEECSTWVRERLWHMMKLGGLFAFEQDPCYGGFGSHNNYIAKADSSTGWARQAASELLDGLEHERDGIEMVFAHKNLIVVRKTGGPVPNITSVHENPKGQRKHPPPRLEL